MRDYVLTFPWIQSIKQIKLTCAIGNQEISYSECEREWLVTEKESMGSGSVDNDLFLDLRAG